MPEFTNERYRFSVVEIFQRRLKFRDPICAPPAWKMAEMMELAAVRAELVG